MGRIVIVGVGNLLLKDEGVGIHAARALQSMELPENVEIIDGGTSPDLIAYVKGGDKLVIVDAVQGGCEPGTIYRIPADKLKAEMPRLLSIHELGVIESIALMRLGDNAPAEAVIIGVEPGDISLGTELTPELERELPEIVSTVIEEMGR